MLNKNHVEIQLRLSSYCFSFLFLLLVAFAPFFFILTPVESRLMEESKKNNERKKQKPKMRHSANLFPVIAMFHQPSLHFASQTNEGKHLFFFFFFCC